MWDWLSWLNFYGRTPWWWRDSIILAQLQAFFSVVAAMFALGAILYARHVAKKQFELMRDQDRLMNRQLELIEEETATSKRLEVLTTEQANILRRQGEIAETQHQILEVQRAKQPQLYIRTGTMHPVYKGMVVPLYVHNDGDATVSDFRWEVIVPAPANNDMEFKNSDGTLPARTMIHGADKWHVAANVSEPIYPEASVLFTTLTYNHLGGHMGELVLLFRVASGFGYSPRAGHFSVTLRTGEDRSVTAVYDTVPL